MLHKEKVDFSFIYDLIFHFDFDQRILTYVLNETKENFLYKLSNQQLTVKDIFAVSQRLNIPMYKLLNKEINWQQLKLTFMPEIGMCLPNEYAHCAGTPSSCFYALYNYILHKYNKIVADSILNYLDINLFQVFSTDYVNVNLINNFFYFCSKYLGLNHEHINEMSIYVYLKTQREQILDLTKACSSDLDFLKVMVDKANQYEVNFKYELITDGENYILKSCALEKVHDELKLKKINCNETIYFKQCTIQNTTFLAQKNKMNVLNVERQNINNIEQINYYIKENNSGSFGLLNIH